MPDRYEEEFATKFTSEGADRVASDMRKLGSAAGGGGPSFKERYAEAFAFLGPRIEAMGDRLNQLSDDWARQYREAGLVQTRFRSLGESQGWTADQMARIGKLSETMMLKSGFDDEAILQSSVAMMNWGMRAEEIEAVLPGVIRQARTTGQSVEDIGNAIGKAYSAGNLGNLKRAKISVDDQSLALWKAKAASTDWSDATQVAALRSLVLQGAINGINETAMPLDAIMNSAAARADLFAAKQGNVAELLGEGSDSVIQFRRNLLGLVGDFAVAHPEAVKFAGAAGAVTGQVIKGAGAVGSFMHDWVGFAASLKIAKNAKDALKVATIAEKGAEVEKTAVAKGEAAALGQGTLAAKKKAASMGKLQSAMTGGLGFGGLMQANAGTALTGGLGAGAAATSIISVAAAGVIGWMVGQQIANYLESKTQYQEKGGAALADYVYGTGAQDKWAESAATQKEIDVMRARARGERKDRALSGAEMQSRHAAAVATIPGYGVYSYATSPGSKPLPAPARTTPSGDLRVTIPGEQVVTTQAARDHAALR